MSTGKLVGQCTETELIAAFAPYLQRGPYTLVGPGDDCALITAPDARFVISTDMLVEGVHFRRGWSSAFQVGQTAAARNLADIAAMGAVPSAMVCSLALPQDLPTAWVVEFCQGLASYGCAVEGGDLVGSKVLTISVTVTGDLGGAAPILRSGAQVGDQVVLCGQIGMAAAGWAAFESGRGSNAYQNTSVLEDAARQAFLAPHPPLEMGPVLRESGATAMLDTSDGLLLDGQRLAAASGVQLDLSSSALSPFVTYLQPLAEQLGVDPWKWVLAGGEDHCLLATIAPHREVSGGDVPVVPVGTVRAGAGITLDGKTAPRARGWDHFMR
ncbi:MAG: thiamine-phosphate kinase [Actinomycetaceae bacterium]|nr:thiamine-phosphate kinase [Actinomycetaceae bacterium]